MLVALEAVLGIDNLLYIAIESVEWIQPNELGFSELGSSSSGDAVALLLLLVQLIQWFQKPSLR